MCTTDHRSCIDTGKAFFYITNDQTRLVCVSVFVSVRHTQTQQPLDSTNLQLTDVGCLCAIVFPLTIHLDPLF